MMKIFRNMKRKHLWAGLLICLCLMIIWICFFRNPIMPGEKNLDHLELKDKIQSEKVLESMPRHLRTAIEEQLIPKYNGHLLFLEADKTYYAMVDVSGTLLKINTASAQITEVFSVHQYACALKVKQNQLYFLTGIRESRAKRSIAARFIHSSQIRVLTEIQSWKFDFLSGELE